MGSPVSSFGGIGKDAVEERLGVCHGVLVELAQSVESWFLEGVQLLHWNDLNCGRSHIRGVEGRIDGNDSHFAEATA